MKSKIVNSSELGTNCWCPARFCDGIRCKRIFDCKYPEKLTCKAVGSEIAYIKEYTQQVIRDIQELSNKQLTNLQQTAQRKIDELRG